MTPDPSMLARWLRRAGLLVTLAFVALVATATPVLAQIAPNGDVSPDTPSSAYLTINNTLVLIITGAVLPVLNGFLLRPENPGWMKVLVASVVATAAHAFSQVIQQDGTAVLTQEWLLGLSLTIVAMIASYIGVWKPALNPNATLPTPVQPQARGG
jgi:hypothetical protein